jgi:hypothetical protein
MKARVCNLGITGPATEKNSLQSMLAEETTGCLMNRVTVDKVRLHHQVTAQLASNTNIKVLRLCGRKIFRN